MQTCIWTSWCHCHSLSLASVKSRLVLPFWYRRTRVVLDKGPLNGCVCPSWHPTNSIKALMGDGTTEYEMMKYYNGLAWLHCPISYPTDALLYLGIWLGLDDDIPANMALQLHVNVSLNRPPDCMWSRPPGRPRNKWLHQLRNDSAHPTGDLWRDAVNRGYGGGMT